MSIALEFVDFLAPVFVSAFASLLASASGLSFASAFASVLASASGFFLAFAKPTVSYVLSVNLFRLRAFFGLHSLFFGGVL
jgi:hypothetical protein